MSVKGHSVFQMLKPGRSFFVVHEFKYVLFIFQTTEYLISSYKFGSFTKVSYLNYRVRFRLINSETSSN